MDSNSLKSRWAERLEHELGLETSARGSAPSNLLPQGDDLSATARLVVALLLQVLRERHPSAFRALTRGEDAPESDSFFYETAAAYRMLLSLLGLSEGYHQYERYSRMGLGFTRTFEELRKQGVSADRILGRMEQMDIRLVATAHPTNIFRSIILGMRREIYGLIEQLQRSYRGEARFAETVERLKERIVMMAATRFGRWEKPDVLDEVRQVIGYFRSSIYQAAPSVEWKLRSELARVYSDSADKADGFDIGPVLRFGSWVGGDMDGNPFVNADVYRKAVAMQRQAALELFSEQLRSAAPSLSLAYNAEMNLQSLVDSLQSDLNEMENAGLDPDPLARYVRREPFRLKLELIRIKIDRTLQSPEKTLDRAFRYSHPDEVLEDLEILEKSLGENGFHSTARNRVYPLQNMMRMFGFHLASLDMREDSLHIARAARLVLKAAGHNVDPENPNLYEGPVPSPDYATVLTEEILNPRSVHPSRLKLEPDNGQSFFRDEAAFQGVQRIFAMLPAARDARELAGERITTNLILTMTSRTEDILHALLLLKTTGHFFQDLQNNWHSNLDIVPLFETIQDLQNGPGIMEKVWDNAAYRSQLMARQNTQLIMLGFSDSNKDGGYFTSNWSINNAQRQLLALAEKHGIKLRFFYGRGGSIGRGGASSKHAAHSLPVGAMQNGYELTEQGEVLSRYYVTREIATMHLETLMGAALEKNCLQVSDADSRFLETADKLSRACQLKYRQLIHDDPALVQYFEEANPREVELVKIGSRPGRRRQMRAITDLRAIPWVFRWFQSRQILPGWFGFGSGMETISKELSDGGALLQEMYDSWPFFRAITQNSALALMHTNLEIAANYRDLSHDPESAKRIFAIIEQEYSLCKDWFHKLGCDPADFYARDFPVLLSAWKIKEPWVNALGILQSRLLNQYRQKHLESDGQPENVNLHDELQNLENAVISSIEGVALGLGTTG